MPLRDPLVKGRSYDASRRRQAAAQNRERVLAVAEQLLLSNGYADTTVASIARGAEVSVELVYKSFGGKAGLVREIQRGALQGSGTTPAEGRSDTFSAGSQDAATVIRSWATLSIEVAPRVSPVVLLVRSAASSDQELAVLLEEITTQRLERMTYNAQRLLLHHGLRADLDVERVRDVLWTYSSPDLYDLLVVQRGWTVNAYGDFLFRGMAAQLLEP
jgi:AcrR family transcriptional regulator